ncbi:MAG: arsenate reductase-like glutaredoxin family protein [Oleispira sp.]|jgi:hypothetical protein
MSLSPYINAFSNIKMNASGGHSSPHKACLLLAIMDLIEDETITHNRIFLNDALIQRFNKIFSQVAKVSDKADISQPFFYLQSSSFWHHKVVPTHKEEYQQRTAPKQRNHGGINKVNQLIQYAYLDAELFEYFKSPIAREALTQALLSKLDSQQQKNILIPSNGWSWNECELIVNDYFDMLIQELSGQKYNKAQHNRGLVQAMKESRNRSAIENKHQNISAILKEMGMPIIDGYKPLSNYQRNILPDVVGATIAQHKDIQQLIQQINQQPVEVPTVEDILQSLVDAPESRIDTNNKKQRELGEEARTENPEYEAKRYPLPKKDYLAQEAMNQALGLSGEKHVVNYEKARLIYEGKESLADKIEHISLSDDGVGYDIHSYNANGKDRFIEVKTTNYDRYRQFYISPNELKVSQQLGQDYHLYRVFNFKASPKLFISQGSLDNGYNLSPSAYFANIK